MDEAVMTMVTRGCPNSFVEPHQTEDKVQAALAGRVTALEGHEVRELCWGVYQGRNGFTGVCWTLQEHNLRVTRASGVQTRNFGIGVTPLRGWKTSQRGSATGWVASREGGLYCCPH